MKKLLDLTHENLVNILGGHGIGNNIHGCHHKPRNLCTKISSLLIAIVSHCMSELTFFPEMFIVFVTIGIPKYDWYQNVKGVAPPSFTVSVYVLECPKIMR